MSSKKVEHLGIESRNDEEIEESLQFIQMGLESLDEGVEIETPNIQFFEEMVAEQKEIMQKKLIKDVAIFLCIALIIVSVLLFTLYQVPLIFLALQGAATIFVIIYSARGHFKQVDEA